MKLNRHGTKARLSLELPDPPECPKCGQYPKSDPKFAKIMLDEAGDVWFQACFECYCGFRWRGTTEIPRAKETLAMMPKLSFDEMRRLARSG